MNTQFNTVTCKPVTANHLAFRNTEKTKQYSNVITHVEGSPCGDYGTVSITGNKVIVTKEYTIPKKNKSDMNDVSIDYINRQIPRVCVPIVQEQDKTKHNRWMILESNTKKDAEELYDLVKEIQA